MPTFERSVLALLLLFSLAGTALSAPPAAAPGKPAAAHPYTLTVIPYYSPEKIWTKYSPLIDHLKRATGKPWELKLYHNHDALLDALCGGEVSFALLGPVPLGRAIDRCGVGIEAVALGKDGKPFYRAVIATGDPAVRTLADLKGRRFALFKGSTAAHIIPLKMLREAGIAEAELAPVFYESQDRMVNALLERDASGGGVKEVLYRKFRGDQLRLLKMSDPVPGFAIASAPAVNAAARTSLAAALTALDPRGAATDRQLMQEWDEEVKNGFILPPAAYRSSVLAILSVYREITHEVR